MASHDDGEGLSFLEPLMVAQGARSRSKLNDLALSLAEQSAAFTSSLPPAIAIAVADLGKIVNCYYSNLIEGDVIDPLDIERAKQDDYSKDAKIRIFQLEARAHIAVEEWIDDGDISGTPFSADVICEVHRRFYERLPLELRVVATRSGSKPIEVVPGGMRSRSVKVGRHVPISPGSVPRFLARMEQGYSSAGRIDRILAAAYGHHRLLWVHPFLDGNGRVARLVSHAALNSSLRMAGLWSLSRGLARRKTEYMERLQSCDEPRRDSHDGRGALSENALADFAEFFLNACIAEIDLMSRLIEPSTLRNRVLIWAQEEVRAGRLPPKSDLVLSSLLYRGELERAEIAVLTGASSRSARRLTAALIDSGVVQSQTSRTPLRLALPVGLAMRFLPGLLPES